MPALLETLPGQTWLECAFVFYLTILVFTRWKKLGFCWWKMMQMM